MMAFMSERQVIDYSLAAPILTLRVNCGWLFVCSYVSFVEIFAIKAIDGFIDANHDDDSATRYATFCFFGGIIITAALDALVHFLMQHSQKRAAAHLVKANSNFSDDSLVEVRSSILCLFFQE